eukprot:scaffold3645_cov140-Chaetoceros_neogracile.AAC.1
MTSTLPEANSLGIGDLKKELDSYGISTKSFFEKRELVIAVNKERSKKAPPHNTLADNNPTSTTSAPAVGGFSFGADFSSPFAVATSANPTCDTSTADTASSIPVVATSENPTTGTSTGTATSASSNIETATDTAASIPIAPPASTFLFGSTMPSATPAPFSTSAPAANLNAGGRLFGSTSTTTASTCTKRSTVSPTSSSKKNNLELAAEALAEAAELVAAASQEVDPVTQNLEALMCSFETELKALTKSIKASNENFDARINTVNQKIANLCLATEKTNTLLESQAKIKRLELAISSVGYVGSFPIRQWNVSTCGNNRNYKSSRVYQSSDEVKRILHHFV